MTWAYTRSVIEGSAWPSRAETTCTGTPASKLRGSGVPQIVDPETVAETGAAAGSYEDGAPPVGQSHDAAARHGEHGMVGVLACDGRRELGGQEPGTRDRP
jgi:hypothetical protein